jgi:plasmid stabilization system protein ParE
MKLRDLLARYARNIEDETADDEAPSALRHQQPALMDANDLLAEHSQEISARATDDANKDVASTRSSGTLRFRKE